MGYDLAVVNNDFDDATFEEEEDRMENEVWSDSDREEDGTGDDTSRADENDGHGQQQEHVEDAKGQDREEYVDYGGWQSAYTAQELRTLMAVHVHLLEVPLFVDVSLADAAVYDNGLLTSNDEPTIESAIIRKGMRFPTLEALKLWLRTMQFGTIVHSLWFTCSDQRDI